MTELHADTRALLSKARLSRAFPPDRKRHLKTALLAQIAAGAWVGTGTAATASLASKLAITFALGTGIGVTAVTIHHWDEPAAQHTTAAVQSVPPSVLELPSADPVVVPPPAPVASTAQSITRIQSSPSTTQSDAPVEAPALQLRRQVMLIREAQRHLDAGNSTAALVKLAEYDRDFPQGSLQPESRVLRILALCREGRVEEARRAARPWLDRNSPLPERLAGSCVAGATVR